MNQTTTLETPASEVAELQAGIAQCFAEIDQLREMMRRDDVEIARSQARTRALLAEIDEIMRPTERKVA